MTTATEEIVVSVTPRNRANFRRLKTNSIQSYKRWEKENELLYAMMEDESEWLAKLFPDVVISPDFFFYALEDGSLLCRLANYIQEKAELYSKRHHIPVPGKKFRYHTMGKCSKEIKLFKSRENVQQFLTWCRNHGIPEAILFESNDVVQVDDYREGCRGIIICLMEIVRRTAKFELDELPKLIQMEKEIEEDEAQSHTDISNGQGQVLDVVEINNHDREVQGTDPQEIQSPSSLDSDSGVDSVFDLEEGDNAASRLKEFWHEEREIIEKTEITTTTVTRKQNLLKPKDQKSSPKKTSKELPSLLESTGPKSELDKQVCKIAQDYNIKIVHRLKEGKYIILGRIMFVRMLNDHMLVRIGGGWDTLEHYLMTHAPSKEALETRSTPSSQAFTSPRNSISANSGVRTSLIEKYKKKEQVGVVNRDSPVYSSQGSLHQQLGNQTSPKIKDRGKRSSLTGKDEKDITEAIRKISSSVSQTLADRPASFTSRTFNILKSRFDKGIFGASRRTSSPDISVKGSKIRRRLSDTTAMADVATTLAFDGEQVPVVNNNVSEEKQPDSESTEEIGVGKIVVPNDIASGEEPSDNTAPDQIDGTVPAEDSLSSEQSRLEDLLGSQANGNDNMPDVSSFDPLAAAAEQDRPVLTDTTSSEKPEEQPSNSELIGNGELTHDEQPSEPETTVEPSPPQDLDNLLEIADTKPVLDNTPEASPRPIDIGDLLQDSQVSAAVEGTVESSPLISVEETAAPKESAPETEGADAEPVNSDNPVVNEDTTPSVEDVPPSEVDPSPEAESQPPEVAPAKIEEPSTGEETVGISESLEPSKLEEEPTKPDEAVRIEETAAGEPEPPKPEEGTVKIDEPVSHVADVKSEGERTEVVPTMEETSTQEESQAQEAAVVEVAEGALVIAAEVKEEQKPAEDQPLKAEKPNEKTTKAKPAAAGGKEKSASKPSSAVKKPTGAARPTSPTKVSTSAAAKKDVKPPTKKVPPSKPASANASAVKATAAKAPTAKTPATKTPTSAAAGVKKLAAKSNETKADEAKKPQRPKSAVSARPSTQPAGRATRQAPDKKVLASATKTAATKPPGQDVKDGGPPKSAPKTTTAKPSSAKPTPKTTTTGKKPFSAKPTPTPSTKPADSKDGTAPPKKPAARPTSAKPKPTTSSTTTTTTVKKTTTITTTVTKSGTAPPGKTQTTTTKTVTQAKTGQPKTTASTTTTTKTSAKASTRPTSAAKKPTDIKPASTGAKSKIGGKPSVGSVGGKPTPKSASKKTAEEPAKEKELKQEDKQPISQPEPEAATEEKPTEEVETKTENKPTETVEPVSEERSVSEAISEEKSIEPTPDSSAAEQTPESIEVSSEEFVDQSNVVTHVITTETTTVNEDGEEQTTTTTEESVNEQTVEGS